MLQLDGLLTRAHSLSQPVTMWGNPGREGLGELLGVEVETRGEWFGRG